MESTVGPGLSRADYGEGVPDGLRVAALYDIHGNLPALDSVLQAVERSEVDVVVVGGDVVPGPMAAECLDRLLGRQGDVRFLFGNGEVALLKVRRGEVPERVPEAHRATLTWVAERLDPAHLEALAAWPAEQRLRIGGLGTVLFCHATPGDENRVFTERTPESRLLPVFDPADADVVMCGHTHMQFDRVVGSTRVVNAGSVGMCFGEAKACWALLEPGGIHLRRETYDLDLAEDRIRAIGFPDSTGFRLRHPPGREAMLERLESAALGAPPPWR